MLITFNFDNPKVNVSTRFNENCLHICVSFTSGERYEHGASVVSCGNNQLQIMVENDLEFLGDITLTAETKEEQEFFGPKHWWFYNRNKETEHIIILPHNVFDVRTNYQNTKN